MTKKIDAFAENFERHFKNVGNRFLAQGLYLETDDTAATLSIGDENGDLAKPKTMACALGAFFQADSHAEAWLKAKATNAGPRWLIDATPDLFDSIPDYEEWGRSIYGADGALQRAGRMPAKERKALFHRVLGEIAQRMLCHCPENNRNADAEWVVVRTLEGYGDYDDDMAEDRLTTVLEMAMGYSCNDIKLAWTITRAFHEELEKLGY